MSVAAFGRVLRTLGGRNIGKCRLRAHLHPLSPPLSNLLEPAPCKTSKARRVLERVLGDELGGDVWGCVLKIGCFVHRFLISGPNLGIDAGFSPFTRSFVHRFLISGSDLGIDASFSPFKPSSVHRFLISSPNLRIDARFSPETSSFVQRFLNSGTDLRIDARFRMQNS